MSLRRLGIVVGMLLLSPSGCDTWKDHRPHDRESPAGPTRQLIHAGQAFYEDRPEPEETFNGIVVEVPAPNWPDSRNLPFELHVDGQRYPIFVVGDKRALVRAFVGRRVLATGKRIDLRPEGFTVEIWPAVIEVSD